MYTVDRIENMIAILEERNTGEMIEISILKLPKNIKEGNIVDLKNNEYIINDEKTKSIQKSIKDLFNNLKE